MAGTSIALPHGGPGASFDADELVKYVRDGGRSHIIVGGDKSTFAKHPKPNSLDYWLRETKAQGTYKNRMQTINQVIDDIVATGTFARAKLLCPDSPANRSCNALQLVKQQRKRALKASPTKKKEEEKPVKSQKEKAAKSSGKSAKKAPRNFIQFTAGRDKLGYDFDYNPKETEALRKHFRKKGELTIDDLRRVALWKINRALGVPDSLLKDLNTLARMKKPARDSKFVKEIIESLVACDGIHYPMASAILKFLQPKVFPIIDVRAYRALNGRKISRKTYSLRVYLDYADELEALSKKLGLALEDIDEQLYKFDEDKNGKI